MNIYDFSIFILFSLTYFFNKNLQAIMGPNLKFHLIDGSSTSEYYASYNLSGHENFLTVL